VREHAERGYKLLNELGGFDEGVRRLVLDHHERLDGLGYPRGLVAEQLSLDTRILSVCDVYDALISKRVYRAAWTHEDAMAHLRGDQGFDQRCVESLARVVERELLAERVSKDARRVQPHVTAVPASVDG
jgi:two-component system response regulator RpfG